MSASPRRDALAVVEWGEAHKAAFLHRQFTAQHTYCQEHYAGADFLGILVDDCAAGRLYLARWNDEILIVDIALLPAYRHAGIGSTLLRTVMAEAAQAGTPVRIHVEQQHPALRLYTRLGFQPIADRGVYWFLEWAPTPSPPGSGQG